MVFPINGPGAPQMQPQRSLDLEELEELEAANLLQSIAAPLSRAEQRPFGAVEVRISDREDTEDVSARVEQLRVSHLAAQPSPVVAASSSFPQPPVISQVSASSDYGVFLLKSDNSDDPSTHLLVSSNSPVVADEIYCEIKEEEAKQALPLRASTPYKGTRSCNFDIFRRNFKDAPKEIVDEAVRWVQINHKVHGNLLKKADSQINTAQQINIANRWLDKNGYDLRVVWTQIGSGEVPASIRNGDMMPNAKKRLLQLCQYLREKSITSSSGKRPLELL